MATVAHFGFPFALDASGHPRVVEQDSLDHVRDQVHVALLTRPTQGTPLRPSWGTPDLNLQQQPLDVDALTRLLLDLVPSAELFVDQLPELIEQGVARLNVYVSTGG